MTAPAATDPYAATATLRDWLDKERLKLEKKRSDSMLLGIPLTRMRRKSVDLRRHAFRI